MSRATLFSGLLVALLLSLLGGALLAASTLILAPLTALRLLVALLGLLYLAWLLSKSDEKRGRLVAPVVYMTASGLMLFSNISLAGLAIGHAGLIWLARSLFLHERPLAAICRTRHSGTDRGSDRRRRCRGASPPPAPTRR